ncbi:MAG TPA: hypothetical protein VIU39_08145, partial [Anaerolineales bacterium]
FSSRVSGGASVPTSTPEAGLAASGGAGYAQPNPFLHLFIGPTIKSPASLRHSFLHPCEKMTSTFHLFPLSSFFFTPPLAKSSRSEAEWTFYFLLI